MHDDEAIRSLRYDETEERPRSVSEPTARRGEAFPTLSGERPSAPRSRRRSRSKPFVLPTLGQSPRGTEGGPTLTILMGLAIIAVLGFIISVTLSRAADDPQADSGLAVGTCLDGALGSPVGQTLPKPCAGVHVAEVLAVFELDASTAAYPGVGPMSVEHRRPCEAAFRVVTGVELTATDKVVAFYLPSEASWLSGDRTIVCAASSPAAMLTSPIAP